MRQEAFPTDSGVNTRTIEQTVTFKASRHVVYEMLMDPAQHAAFTGAEVSINRQLGGAFTAYDGSLTGTIYEMIRDTKIIQYWRAVSDDWPQDHYSVVTFFLEETEDGTRLRLTQTGVPEKSYDDISQGWKDHYWSKMESFLESQ